MSRPFVPMPRVLREIPRWLVQAALLVAVPPAELLHHERATSGVTRALDDAKGALGDGALELDLAWSRPLGAGYAGLATAAGRLVTMHADGGRDAVVALDVATGIPAWSHPLGATFPAGGGSEGGAKSTPAIDDGSVYALGPDGTLVALGLAGGAERWRRHLRDELGATPPEFGYATSPIVVGDLLVVQAGAGDGRSLIALDKASGELRWAVGDDLPDYASPIVAELAGTRQIVSVTHSRVTAVEPATGRTLWTRASKMDVVASPVPLGEDRLLVAGTTRAEAWRVKRGGEGLEVERLWTTRDLRGSYSTPVARDGFVYGYGGDLLTCVSAADGATRWRSRQPGGRALTRVGGHLVIFGRGGSVVVADASPAGYREVARVTALDRSGYTYPSYADGRIFVRSTRAVAAVRVEPAGRNAGYLTSVAELARTVPLRLRGTAHEIQDWFFARLNPRARPGAADAEGDGSNAAIGFHQEAVAANGSRRFRTDGKTSYGLALVSVPAGGMGLLSPPARVVLFYPDSITDLATLAAIVGAPGPALPTSWVSFASTIDAFTAAPGAVLVSSGLEGEPFRWSSAPLGGSRVGEVAALGTPTPVAVEPGVHELEPGAFELGGARYDRGVADDGLVTGATIVSKDFQI